MVDAARSRWLIRRHAVVTFNREIYNYNELHRGLEAKGYVLYGNSETEVLLQF